MPKISVIIPVYNSEKYIHQCVDSVLAQTLTDIEILLMDDGSKDESPSICDAYAQKDPRVRIIHKENRGYGSTINQAIQLASGDYIGIVEADDFIEPDMYEKLYTDAAKHQTDITKCYFSYFNKCRKKQNVRHRFTNPAQTEPVGPFHVSDYPHILTYHSSIWAAIYRRDFIKNIRLTETPGASYQDFPFVFEALLKAKRLSIVPEYLLHYRKENNQNSSTCAPGRQVLYLVSHARLIRQTLDDMGLYEKYKNEFLFHAIVCLNGYFRITPETYREEYYEQLHTFFSEYANDIPWNVLPPVLTRFISLLVQGKKNELFLTLPPKSKLYRMWIRFSACFIMNKQRRRQYRQNKLN